MLIALGQFASRSRRKRNDLRAGNRRAFAQIVPGRFLADLGQLIVRAKNAAADLDERHLRLDQAYDRSLARFRRCADRAPGHNDAGGERSHGNQRVVDTSLGIWTSRCSRAAIAAIFSDIGSPSPKPQSLSQLDRFEERSVLDQLVQRLSNAETTQDNPDRSGKSGEIDPKPVCRIMIALEKTSERRANSR